MSNRFEEIYAKNEWVHGSGEGSHPYNTQGYVAFLSSFLRKNRISTVVDMGCGDWQFSRLVQWGTVNYHGFDVVPSVVARDQEQFASAQFQFSMYSGDPAELPGADLLIVKDVLQHLSDGRIREFLPVLKRFRMALVTNCVEPAGPTVHRDIEDGQFRPLDLREPPFNVPGSVVYTFTNRMNPIERLYRTPRWKKNVLLVENKG